jgi:long-subunit acyl-CoA synthetase (AMP-forming)
MQQQHELNPVSQAIRRYAASQPQASALVGRDVTLNYQQLVVAVQDAARQLISPDPIVLALDNSAAWAVLDLAALESGVPVIPLPFFFSAEQVIHALSDSGACCLLTDQPEYYEKLMAGAGVSLLPFVNFQVAGKTVTKLRLAGHPVQQLPKKTAKVTYTSGTTGTPKGVCLSVDAMCQVAKSLCQASEAVNTDRHLCLLPLATLLENIGGIYAPLLAGACCHLLSLEEVGMRGANGLDLAKMAAAILSSQATSVILTPELLQGLIVAIESGCPVPANLRFVAVGGATVGLRLLQRAKQAGLPVFEGYGLSECASVVALNTPQAYRAGSVGKPLPHVLLSFAEDGEILVDGALLQGYSGNRESLDSQHFWHTGDIGYLDEEGFLYITGRKKNIFITSFGRNVAPEWVERELTLNPAIAQAAVFGEARPFNVAVIVGRGNAQAVEQAIAATNELLPDYARIQHWIAADAPFHPGNQQLTPNGRLRRNVIDALYREKINLLYEETTHAVL